MDSRVESSITKLLLATKQLLEVLNSWSHGNAEERDVSDVYVRLGNEFNLAITAFTNAKIDTSDLDTIPEDLRVILESTLAEEASPDALEHYLPRIRSIIINLLQGLKHKQAEYRARSEHAYATPHRSRSMSTHFRHAYSSSQSSGNTIHENSSEKVTPSGREHLVSMEPVSSTSRSSSSFSATHPITEKHPLHDITSSSPFSGTHQALPTSMPSSSDLSSSPYPLSSTNDSTTPNLQSPRNHLLSSLQRSNTLDKRPRKRYSLYSLPHFSMEYTSPLQNVSQISSEDKKPNAFKDILEKNIGTKSISLNNQPFSTSAYDNISTDKNTNTYVQQEIISNKLSENHLKYTPKSTTFTLFLQYGSQVKKVTHSKDISLNGIRALFIEKFEFNPCNDNFPPLYIQDDRTRIFYELEDAQDITDRSLISLKIQDVPNKALEDGISSLTKELQSLKTSFEGQREMISEMASRPSTCVSKVTLESISRHENIFLRTQKNHSDIVKNIRQELDSLRTIYTDFTLSMKSSMMNIDSKAKKVKNVVFGKLGGSRHFIELGKKKLEVETQSLVTKIENLSDIVSSLRIDVINRKVRPLPQQLDDVRKKEAQIQKDMISLINHLQSLSPCWRQLWEMELQNVVEEQEFLAHQENFIEDLKADIVSTMEIFGNIVTYSEYQEKNAHLNYSLLKQGSTDSLNTLNLEARNAKPELEIRANTIPKIEKQENNFRFYIDKFKYELDEFLSKTKFKNVGCMDEVERIRKEKDEGHLKEIYFSSKQSKKNMNGIQNELNEESSS
ncbi:hypothetical protein PNEG_02476 [Pneumocystis murina B123]|uniref:Actin interacting protein 3 C-terminal domain-containing protein n=1 Tax=Pneumocystis murina (strain B123) TaxID=1069680 RepID=M7NKG5_PNEMU|nr:hypothetical protein PNEG_02476 [Pneumocystis murina B123]EMR09133.1 hypothetical protein PNEG_02476 [Pneumocystis murina B123]